jgi:hypothetical protein
VKQHRFALELEAGKDLGADGLSGRANDDAFEVGDRFEGQLRQVETVFVTVKR